MPLFLVTFADQKARHFSVKCVSDCLWCYRLQEPLHTVFLLCCVGESPRRARGSLIGMINEKEFGVAYLEANITENEADGTSTLEAHVENIPPSVGECIYMHSVVWPCVRMYLSNQSCSIKAMLTYSWQEQKKLVLDSMKKNHFYCTCHLTSVLSNRHQEVPDNTFKLPMFFLWQ